VDPRNLLVELLDPHALAFADRTAGAYLWINLDPTSPYEGTFLYAVEDAGLFWGDGMATQTTRPDGSVEVRYHGLGWNDAIGTFDPLLWSYDLNGDPSAMLLQLRGVVGADRSTASAELVADGQLYELNDGPPIGGADAAIAEIAALVEAEDWRSLYLRIQKSFRDSINETRFVSEMTNGVLSHGEVASVVVTSEPTVTDSGMGWDVARAEFDVTLVKDGRPSTHSVDVEVVADGGTWWLTSISRLSPDASPTISATAAP
jgi:hypothetical protein